MVSIKGQTYQNIEHIFIDGRSTDQSLAVLNKFATPNTKVISEDDAGIYDALNKGIAHAQGDFIGFVHSDDLYGDHGRRRLIRLSPLRFDRTPLNRSAYCSRLH